MNSKFAIVLACFLTIGVTGCSTNSDYLGFGDKNAKNYLESYAPAREILRTGQYEKLRDLNLAQFSDDKENSITEMINKLAEQSSDLSLVERGLVFLNVGDVLTALFYFDAAEQKMEQLEREGGGSIYKGIIAVISGKEELSDYNMRGYEKVMLLNYKALCYLLLGYRKAYNVTRRAIDRQQYEWEKFQKHIATVEEQNKQSEQELQKQTSSVNNGSYLENNLEKKRSKNGKVFVLTKEQEEEIQRMPNAYVNPFADFMNALIMEIDGQQDPTMKDNALIAYQKVLASNPDCTVAAEAIVDLQQDKPHKGKRLVYVLLSDGFAPQRESFNVSYEDFNHRYQAVNYTEAIPVPSMVKNAYVYVGNNSKNSYQMSSLSKVEIMVLRDELDRAPEKSAMFFLAQIRNLLLDYDTVNKDIQQADTRSWLTLPRSIVVARMYVPKNIDTITIKTYDRFAYPLASKQIKIPKDVPTVIYATSYDRQLNLMVNEKSWVTAQ